MTPRQRAILAVFVAADFGWVRGNTLFEAGGLRFGARLYELDRKHGYRHEKRHDPTSALPLYRLYRPDEQLTLLDRVAS